MQPDRLQRDQKTPRHIALLKRIHPRRGLLVNRWGPGFSRSLNRLTARGLVDWEIGSDPYRVSLHIKLTRRGKAQRLGA